MLLEGGDIGENGRGHDGDWKVLASAQDQRHQQGNNGRERSVELSPLYSFLGMATQLIFKLD